MGFDLIWGCDPNRQFETYWIKYLLGSSTIQDIPAWNQPLKKYHLNSDNFPVLVESGLLHLERSPSLERMADVLASRLERIQLLHSLGAFGVIHISDEEGNDARSWYHLLPSKVCLWRNFCNPSLNKSNLTVKSFPIGPRQLFLDQCLGFDAFQLASKRTFPWVFMGTLWSSGSRFLAVSLFLRSLPTGFFFAGRSFGVGLPLPSYRNYLLDSAFALAPEGDRHLDTFRLWEILSCGSIPLVVDFRNSSHYLLQLSFPVPIFATWFEALDYAKFYLAHPGLLDKLQSRVYFWWFNYQLVLSHRMHIDFA